MSALNVASEPLLGSIPVADEQYIAFRCGDTNYGVPVMSVREIRSWQPTVPIPGRHPAARGVMDIRGTVVEVFDFGALLGGAPISPSPGSVVLVLSLDGRLVGALVDAVSDIIQASVKDLMPAPPADLVDSGRVKWMINHDDRLVAVLDLAVVLG